MEGMRGSAIRSGRMRGSAMRSGSMSLVITHYCMQFNGIGDEGVRAIARALKYNTCISHLDLSVCSEEVAGVEQESGLQCGGCCFNTRDGL